jgi:small subunit ribosomal protein S6
MALYEITFLTKEETDPGVKALVEEAGGVISEESSLGRRKLTYPIKKETQAVYTTYVFDLESSLLTELNRRLSLNTQVLRYLIVNKPLIKADKEMSKTVREAIEAAEKLDDTLADAKTETVTAPVEVEAEMPELDELVAEKPVEAPAPVEAMEEVTEEPVKKTRSKKAAPADAAEATEEDRLKALEDKLSDILKD